MNRTPQWWNRLQGYVILYAPTAETLPRLCDRLNNPYPDDRHAPLHATEDEVREMLRLCSGSVTLGSDVQPKETAQ